MGIGDENIPEWYRPYPITHPENHLPKEIESFMPENEKRPEWWPKEPSSKNYLWRIEQERLTQSHENRIKMLEEEIFWLQFWRNIMGIVIIFLVIATIIVIMGL